MGEKTALLQMKVDRELGRLQKKLAKGRKSGKNEYVGYSDF